MANKNPETALIERTLRNSRFWRSGEPFTVNDCHSALIAYRPLGHINSRQVQTILHALLQAGEIEKSSQTGYRVRSSKRALLCRAWR